MVDEIIELIKDALDCVGDEYFGVHVAYQPEYIRRERVFCYELYHQMRCLQKSRGLDEFKLHGEIDKRGYSLLREDDRKNPDFIFHVPGSMRDNFVVAEVKGDLKADTAYKDIETLSKFTGNTLAYKLGLHVVYNYSLLEYKKKLVTNLSDLIEVNGDIIDKIQVLCKRASSSPVEIESLENILK